MKSERRRLSENAVGSKEFYLKLSLFMPSEYGAIISVSEAFTAVESTRPFQQKVQMSRMVTSNVSSESYRGVLLIARS